MCCQTYAWFTETGAVTQRVIKGHQIVVYGATSTCKNRGSMDPVHERGSMDPVHILMDPVHGPGPQRGSMDQGSMFCTFPIFSGVRIGNFFVLEKPYKKIPESSLGFYQ